MKAAVLYQPGGPENFSLEQRPVPVPGEGQVLVKVKAFGLNRSELMTRKGLSPSVSFPRVLGIECVGEVENDPAGAYKRGQKVAAFMGEMGRAYDGSYAEYAVLPGSILTPFNSHLSWEQLGAIPEMFQTVYGSLHLALGIQQNETLLIRGGTSSIGMLATQMAKKQGLYVVATTRKPEKEQLLLDNGVDEVLIDDGHLAPKVRASFPGGIDKILELVGTATLKDSLRCAAQGGTVCMTGMLAEQWTINDFAPMEYIPATVRLTMYSTGQIRVDQSHFQAFIRDVEAGDIKLNISCTFKLDDIAAAHRLMDSNSADGKIVVVV